MKTLKVRQDMGTVDKTEEEQDGTGKEIDQDRKGRKDTVVGQTIMRNKGQNGEVQDKHKGCRKTRQEGHGRKDRKEPVGQYRQDTVGHKHNGL